MGIRDIGLHWQLLLALDLEQQAQALLVLALDQADHPLSEGFQGLLVGIGRGVGQTREEECLVEVLLLEFEGDQLPECVLADLGLLVLLVAEQEVELALVEGLAAELELAAFEEELGLEED